MNKYLLLFSSCCSTTMAFTSTTSIFSPIPIYSSSSSSSSASAPVSRRSSSIDSPPTLLHATLTADELSTMDKMEQLRVLGVESEEKLALGIDPDEVLEFLGTWVYVIQQLTLANFLFHGYRNEDRSLMTWLKYDRYWRTLVASNLGTSIILAFHST